MAVTIEEKRDDIGLNVGGITPSEMLLIMNISMSLSVTDNNQVLLLPKESPENMYINFPLTLPANTQIFKLKFNPINYIFNLMTID